MSQNNDTFGAGGQTPCALLKDSLHSDMNRTPLDSVFVVGLDEAGRGPLAGPVVASAVLLDPKVPVLDLNDSKKLSKKKREILFDILMEKASVGLGIVEAERIDEINILRASLEAMARAVEDLENTIGKKVHGAIVDGQMTAPLPERIVQRAVVGGDGLSPSVMAASIIAKVTRDRRMVAESEKYPEYGFDGHKGYPTAAHRQKLLEFGPCPIHRRSFAPVQAALEHLSKPPRRS